MVYDDTEGKRPLSTELASVLCNRRLGVGADGIMRMSALDGAVKMELRNADGSPAEMSGNGIRCLAQAGIRSGLVEGPSLVVVSVVGERRISLLGRSGSTDFIEVDMGEVVLTEDPPGLEKVLEMGEGPTYLGALSVSVGNPHLVLQLGTEGELAGLDAAAEGSRIEAALGCNVEWVVPRSAATLAMKVFERGVGVTAACGTGSVAVALAAREWGLGGDSFEVENPGGVLGVRLEGGRAALAGPATHVGDVEVDEEWLSEALGCL